MSSKSRSIMTVVFSLFLMFTSTLSPLMAEEETEQEDAALAEEGEFSGYVLMNIPYSAFYAAEGISGVDTVSAVGIEYLYRKW